MVIKTIVNPATNRSIDVYAWPIAPREIVDKLRTKEIKSARELSWRLLNDKEAGMEIEEDLEAPGDSSETSFALNIVENALDWTLGLAVLRFLRIFAAEKKLPHPFEVACSRSGDVFIITGSGRVLKM